jgi:hypothetical protein
MWSSGAAAGACDTAPAVDDASPRVVVRTACRARAAMSGFATIVTWTGVAARGRSTLAFAGGLDA